MYAKAGSDFALRESGVSMNTRDNEPVGQTT